MLASRASRSGCNQARAADLVPLLLGIMGKALAADGATDAAMGGVTDARASGCPAPKRTPERMTITMWIPCFRRTPRWMHSAPLPDAPLVWGKPGIWARVWSRCQPVTLELAVALRDGVARARAGVVPEPDNTKE